MGAWSEINACLAPTNPPGLANCPEATYNAGFFGSVAFELTSDLKLVSKGADTAKNTVNFPSSCLPSGKQCYDLAVTGSNPSWTCGSNSTYTSCICLENFTTLSTGGGTYSVSGTTFTEHVPGMEDITFDYCVRGNTLTIRAFNALTYVLTKQ